MKSNRLMAGLMALLVALQASAFEQVKTKNFADDKFLFPDDISGAATHILFLGIGTGRKNGEWLGEELIKWHKALVAAGVDTEASRFWHFSVMENPPFFVKGVIRRNIARIYVDLIPPQQGAALFVKDAQRFADAAGVPFDGQPVVVVYSEDSGVLALHRGEVSEALVAEIAGMFTESPPAGT